jgi:hypothetical protein
MRRLIPIVALMGCQHLQPGSGAASAHDVNALIGIPSLTCEVGSPTSFTMVALPDGLPMVPAGTVPPSAGADLTPTAPEAGSSVRLDFCLGENDDDFDGGLRRVVAMKFGGFGANLVVDATSSAKVAGVSRAVFNDDYADLMVTIPLETIRRDGADQPTDLAFVLRSAGPKAAVAFVSHMSQGVLAGASPPVLAGKLAFGDLLEEERCPAELIREKIFRLGGVDFTAKICQGLGTGGSLTFDLLEFGVTDSNPALPESVRGKTILFKTSAELRSHFRNKINRHNNCDSFVLTTEHAVYAATGSGQIGRTAEASECGSPVEGAPTRPDPPNDRNKVLFRVRYGDAPPIDTDTGCQGIYLNCRPQG